MRKMRKSMRKSLAQNQNTDYNEHNYGTVVTLLILNSFKQFWIGTSIGLKMNGNDRK
jgi:hypothetical protein